MKKPIIISTFIITLALGYQVGTWDTNQSKVSTLPSEDVTLTSKLKTERSPSSHITVQAPVKEELPQEEESTYKIKSPRLTKSKYFNELLQADKSAQYIFDRSLQVFKHSDKAEEMAAYVALGTQFDSSNEFGEIYQGVIDDLNSSPSDSLKDFQSTLLGLSAKDSFIRAQVLNAVNVLDVQEEQKISFYGEESSREAFVDDEENFTPDSLNITTSMIFLSHNNPDEEKVLAFYQKSLERNDSALIQKKIKTRFQAYFPNFDFNR